MRRQKHINLFESFKSGGSAFRSRGSNYVTCITSEGGWSAVGMLSPSQEKYVNQLDPRGVTIEEFRCDSDSDFVVQDGESGNFMLVRDGDVYRSNYGSVFPILNGKMFVCMAAGHTTDCDIIDPSELSRM